MHGGVGFTFTVCCTRELLLTTSNDSAALARPAVSRRLVMRARITCLIDFIGAQYRRFLLPNKARRTPSSTQPAQGKTGYGSLPRFPLRLCLNFRPEPNHLLEARL